MDAQATPGPSSCPGEIAEQHAESQVCYQVRNIEMQRERGDRAPELAPLYLARLQRTGIEPVQVERAHAREIANQHEDQRIRQ